MIALFMLGPVSIIGQNSRQFGENPEDTEGMLRGMLKEMKKSYLGVEGTYRIYDRGSAREF